LHPRRKRNEGGDVPHFICRPTNDFCWSYVLKRSNRSPNQKKWLAERLSLERRWSSPRFP